jgi:Domain of unknown function (DUF4468) with TBP-like fold
MRFVSLPFVLFVVTCATAAETPSPTLPKLDDGRYGYQAVVTVEGAEAGELLSRARAWIAQNYGSAKAVIQLDDTAGTIVVKGTFAIPWMIYDNGADIHHVLTFEAKAGRYRYTLSDFSWYGRAAIENESALFDYVPTTNGRAKMRDRIAMVATATIASLKAAMQVPSPAKSDW